MDLSLSYLRTQKETRERERERARHRLRFSFAPSPVFLALAVEQQVDREVKRCGGVGESRYLFVKLRGCCRLLLPEREGGGFCGFFWVLVLSHVDEEYVHTRVLLLLLLLLAQLF